MRVLYACCVVLFSAAFFVDGGVRAQGTSASSVSVSSCSQCSVLAEQHELLVGKITTLRKAKTAAALRATQLRKKRQAKQDRLLVLATAYADVQAKELAFGQSKKPGAAEKAAKAGLPAKRKSIEAEEQRTRIDLVTLDKALPQAEAGTRDAEAKLDAAITQRLTLAQAMTNCEQRCVVAAGQGVIVPTAASLTDIARSNQTAIRKAAKNNAQCRDCERLQTQITDVAHQITDKQRTETDLRKRMSALNKERQAIRTEWRDLYNSYSEKLLARLQVEDRGDDTAALDRDLNRISEQIINANARRQKLLTREGQLQDQLMRAGDERDRLASGRRRLRAALSACEEVCIVGVKNPAEAGLRLASQRVNVAKATAKCDRCGSLARLVNDVADTLRARTTERNTLEKQFAQIAPALEQIQARRRSIIKYAGELADLMEEFRQRGDVAQAKRELSQISTRSQRLSTDIIRLLDAREKLDGQIDRAADTITRLSILLRQRRKDFDACEKRCSTANIDVAETVLKRPDLSFATPRPTRVQCGRCAPLAGIVDQIRLVQQSEQASLTMAEAQLKLGQARLIQVDQALALNAQSIRRARSRNEARSSSERRNLIAGLQGEATAVRAEQAKLRKTIASSRATRDTIRARISALNLQIRQRTAALQTCETMCRKVSAAPQSTLSAAARLVTEAEKSRKSCKACDAKAKNVRELTADIRSDRSKLETGIRAVSRETRQISGFSKQIADNRAAALRGVRQWFDLKKPADREARGKAVIDEAWRTARIAKNAEQVANRYVASAAARDKAQSSIASTLPTLEKAIGDLGTCVETCETDQVADAGGAFTEKDPASLFVKPTVPPAVRTSCAECRAKADDVSELNEQRAGAVAKLATARNVKQSAERIIDQIVAKDRDIRGRVATLMSERFRATDDDREAALKRRLDALQAETLRIDAAKRRQNERIHTAEAQTDSARQQIRQLDRAISDTRSELRECENSCKVASTDKPETGETGEQGTKPETTDNGGKDIAQLPGSGTNGTEPDEPGDNGSATDHKLDDAAPTVVTDPAPLPKCPRCLVFSKRITVLSAQRNTLRGERDKAVRARQQIILAILASAGSATQKAKLVRERRQLTRLIEKRNVSIDRVERRLRKLRLSLERCEQSCKVPTEVASNGGEDDVDVPASNGTEQGAPDPAEIDPDTSDETVVGPAPAGRKKPRRTVIADAGDDFVTGEPSLPTRKRQPGEGRRGPVVYGSLIDVLTGGDLRSGGWETSVDVAVGVGNIWVPETATLSVQPVNGSGDMKLDATTFAMTATARDVDPFGSGTVAWGSLKVTRADGSENISVPMGMGTVTASRAVDYNKVSGTIGLGHELYDCLDGGGRCSLGVMAGLEHTSFDERVTGGVPGQGSSVDSTAALAGIWGDMRLPLAHFETAGLALVIKADAYVKAGYASGDVTVAAIAGAQRSSASGAYVGLGGDLSAELELSFDQASIALGGQVGIDTLPTIDGSGGTSDIETDTTTSSTIYIRGKVKF